MALGLVCACSGAPEPPTGPEPKARADASPTDESARGHLARGEEARALAENERARAELEKARDLFEEERDWDGWVRAQNGIGAVMVVEGEHAAAIEHLNQVLHRAIDTLGPGHPATALTHQELGRAAIFSGRPEEALEHYGEALELQRAAAAGEDTPEVAAVLRRMAEAHSARGEDERALALVDEAVGILRSRLGPDHLRVASALIVRGNAHWGRGSFDEAIADYEGAVAILESREERLARVNLAVAYSNLGNAYFSRGDYDEALALYRKALPLQMSVFGAEDPQIAMVHGNIAVIHLEKKDFDACLASAERALSLYVSAFGERHPDVVMAHELQGRALVRKGEPDRALVVLEKALALQRALPEAGDRDSAEIFFALAEAYQARGGDHARAIAHCRRALAAATSIYSERHPNVGEGLLFLGELHRQVGKEDDALRYLSAAIAANDPEASGADLDLDPPIETALSKVVLLDTLKEAARVRAQRGTKRQHLPDLEAAALVYGHASRLIDRMRVGHRAEGSKLLVAARAKETYDEAIRTELGLLRLTGDERHAERAFAYAEKSRAGVLRDSLNEADARAFAGIPTPLLDEERRLRADLAAAEQRRTEAQIAGDVEESRLQALRDEEFALRREYDALRDGFERDYPDYYDLKYRFETASPAQIRERVLDGQTVLVEYFVGQERISIFTVTPSGLEVTDVARGDSLATDVRRLRDSIRARDTEAFTAIARQLYRQLLAPVEDRLEGMSLVVVPDGLLSTLPFEALLGDDASAEGDTRPPFVLRDHAVSYAYSATLLLHGPSRSESPSDELVAFAPALGEMEGAPDALPPLPASRQEVTGVRRLFRKRAGLFGGWFSGRSRVYLGSEATEVLLKSAGLERYRYVHLATHGVVDEEHPGLSRLLLRRQPGSGEDGVLHLGEVYGLRLNADLVVLSACDTGRGQIARGEGIIGLTRGFLYAGAKSLLVSLWPLSDAPTADLVVDFYQELLAGRPKAEALRRAKLRTLARNPEYADPFYWSSLVLVGQPH